MKEKRRDWVVYKLHNSVAHISLNFIKNISHKFQKSLAKSGVFHYTNSCCDMIAMKREVATQV